MRQDTHTATPSIRLQVTPDANKALRQYEDLRAQNDIRRALVIVQLNNDDYQVLGQEMTVVQAGCALWAAVEALKYAEEQTPPTAVPPAPKRRAAGEVNTLAAGWAVLERRWLAPDAVKAHRADLRTAFYAGADCMLGLMASLLSTGEVMTETDHAMLRGWAEELAHVHDEMRAEQV